jgi:DNA-binding NarL/FixJ family response regulator
LFGGLVGLATIRVLLADDNAGVLAYLRALLGKAFDIVGEFENGKLPVEGALGLDPDMVVLDISMPVMNGFQASALLRDLKCRTKIVILTTYEDSEFIAKAFS